MIDHGAPMDLLVVRRYELYGIQVLVRIDFVKKKVDIVDRSGNGGYMAKNWQFVGRTLEYMDGWIAILRAMEYAVGEAKKELENAAERDTEAFLKMVAKLNEIELSDNEDATE